MTAVSFEPRNSLTGRIAALENGLTTARKYICSERQALLDMCDACDDGAPDLATLSPAMRAELEELVADLATVDALLAGGPRGGVGDGIIVVGDDRYMRDARGSLTPVNMIKAKDQLQDETVRKVIGYAVELSEQVSRFAGHTFADLNAFQSLLEQEYGAPKGGAKGNVTSQSYDGLYKVTVQIADILDLGPELQTAKALFDACLLKWGAESRPELRAIVNTVFSVEKEGQINRSGLFQVLRLEVDDPDWTRAQQALRDAIRPVATKRYTRFYRRASVDARWEPIVIDLARA
ncbi:hypothetical protein OSTOST_13938 [Ostertagia ostertagi]